MTLNNDISDFDIKKYKFDSKTKDVLVSKNSGPAVIIIHEIFGFTPNVARFARWVRDAGFKVYCPMLIGSSDAKNPEIFNGKLLFKLCISREFYLFAKNKSSPITNWLRKLAVEVAKECNSGVGALGMCLTGGFALSMAVEKEVLAPVLAQPSMPVSMPEGLDICRTDLEIVKRRTKEENLTIRGYRFEGDTKCLKSKFDTLSNEFGDAFIGVTLPDSVANPESALVKSGQPPHSVFTGDLIDKPNQPTRRAAQEVIDFFKEKLMVA